MSQTLVIHHDKTVVELLYLNLPIYLGTDVITKSDYKESQTLIEHHPGLQLILCADKTDNEATAELVVKLQLSLKKNVPLLVLGINSKVPPSSSVCIIPDVANLKKIIQTAAKFLNVTPKKMVEQTVPDFYPIDIKFCMDMRKTPCEVYLLKGENNYKKHFPSNGLVKKEDLKDLVARGIEKVYVEAVYRLKFVNQMTTSILARLSDPKSSMDEKVCATDEAMQIIQEKAMEEGPIEKSTDELTSVAITACLEIAKSNPKVASLLKKLMANKASFLYKHTQLITHITQHIISNIEWGSSEQKEKLAFVAFFHDICLTEDRWAKFNSDTKLASDEKLSGNEKDIIFKHAKLAAETAQKFNVAPIGSDMIIMQHHGSISGQGFAKNYTNSISPLAIVFIVAEEFAHIILEIEQVDEIGNKKREIIEKLKAKFGRTKYQKIIETLDSINF